MNVSPYPPPTGINVILIYWDKKRGACDDLGRLMKVLYNNVHVFWRRLGMLFIKYERCGVNLRHGAKKILY